MTTGYEQHTDNFYKYFGNTDYQIKDNYSLIHDDNSLLFVNSTIVFTKDEIRNNDLIPKTAQLQDCFRSKGYSDSLIYFKMVGITGMEESKYIMFKDFMDYLVNICGLPFDDIYAVCCERDLDLQNLWNTVGNKKNLHLIEGKTDKFKVTWKYGEGYDFLGRGMTIVANNPEVETCSPGCSIECSCPKYRKIGDAVIIEKKHHKEGIDHKYFDIGFGLERIMAYKHFNSEFKINNYDQIINRIENMGFDFDSAKGIFNINRALFRVFAEGVLPSNNKRGYVVKKIIRELYRLIAEKNKWSIFDICNDYRRVCEIQNYYEIVNSECKILMINEFKKYSVSINKGLIEAKKYINANKNNIDENFYKIIYDTFGVPKELIQDFADNKLDHLDMIDLRF